MERENQTPSPAERGIQEHGSRTARFVHHGPSGRLWQPPRKLLRLCELQTMDAVSNGVPHVWVLLGDNGRPIQG